MADSKKYRNYSRVHMNFFNYIIYLKSYSNNDPCRGIECRFLVIDRKYICNYVLENISLPNQSQNDNHVIA